ncbi:MAG: acyl-CoA/acyl-ACP dehydrogenase [Piscirickettsiaceae bacterium]|nr:acyl-CoA/acyl-ACP dehydrogenase [Piscirickettsiaceae bacterium]
MYSETSKLLEKVEEISRTVIAKNAVKTDKNAEWPEEGIRALLSAGFGGLTVPLEYGGLGHGTETLSKVCEIIGQYCASTSICYGMHCVGSAVIASKVTRYQQEKYLTPICEGKHITSLSLSEVGSGSHFYLPQTKMISTTDGSYLIDGAKSFVTNGGYADSYVVSVVTEEPNQSSGRFNCIIISADSPGVEWGPVWAGLGMRGNSSRNLSLNNVKISDQEILGNIGDQIWYIFNIITPYFLTAITGAYLGLGRAAIEEIRAHVMQRKFSYNDKTIASSSVIQHKIGVLWAKYVRTKALIYYSTQRYDKGIEDSQLDLFSAKAEVADSVIDIVNEGMTLCGGSMYRADSNLNRMLRDARAAHIMSPTTDMLRIWTGRSILDQPLLTDT